MKGVARRHQQHAHAAAGGQCRREIGAIHARHCNVGKEQANRSGVYRFDLDRVARGASREHIEAGVPQDGAGVLYHGWIVVHHENR